VVSGFHLPVLHKVVSRIPESCLLICMGLIVGGIAYAIDPLSRIEQLLFNPDTFFLFILPPIVMEAGYFMPKEPFFANIGTILTYAIIGTVFNAMAIGASLYGVYRGGLMPGMLLLRDYANMEFIHGFYAQNLYLQQLYFVSFFIFFQNRFSTVCL